MTNPTQPAAAETMAEAAASSWFEPDTPAYKTLLEDFNQVALSREREAVRRCAKVICAYCRDEDPCFQQGGKWMHPEVDDDPHDVSCWAGPIREAYPEHFKEDESMAEQIKVLIVFDGEAWFVRRLRAIEHDLDKDEKVYHCDQHLAGPCVTLESACHAAKRVLKRLGDTR